MTLKTKVAMIGLALALGLNGTNLVSADTPTPAPKVRNKLYLPQVARDNYYQGINTLTVAWPTDAGTWLEDNEQACIIAIYTWDEGTQTWLHRFPLWRREYPGSWDEIQTLLPGRTYFVYCKGTQEKEEPVLDGIF